MNNLIETLNITPIDEEGVFLSPTDKRLESRIPNNETGSLKWITDPEDVPQEDIFILKATIHSHHKGILQDVLFLSNAGPQYTNFIKTGLIQEHASYHSSQIDADSPRCNLEITKLEGNKTAFLFFKPKGINDELYTDAKTNILEKTSAFLKALKKPTIPTNHSAQN